MCGMHDRNISQVHIIHIHKHTCGLPRATTHSPGRREELCPIWATGSLAPLESTCWWVGWMEGRASVKVWKGGWYGETPWGVYRHTHVYIHTYAITSMDTGTHLQEGHVRADVDAMDLGGELAPVVERDHDLRGWGEVWCVGDVSDCCGVRCVPSECRGVLYVEEVRTGSSALAEAMTCALVTTRPSSEMMNPEPCVHIHVCVFVSTFHHPTPHPTTHTNHTIHLPTASRTWASSAPRGSGRSR